MSRRHILARLGGSLALAGLLGGCFRPMLATDSSAVDLIGRISFPEFKDRFGYDLNSSLTDRLGRTQDEQFRLEVETVVKSRDLAITQDNAVTRFRLIATAEWKLLPAKGTEPVMQGQEVSQSGYNSTASLFATRAARLDIERRLAHDLGERIARSVLSRSVGLAAAKS